MNPETMTPFTENVYRLILHNGVHRVFRLSELGNTYVAAIVSPTNAMEIAPILVETPREALLGPRPLTITDLLDARITKSFAWKRMKKTFRIQVSMAVTDQTFT